MAQVKYSSETRYLNAVPLFHIGGISSAIAVTMVGGTHVLQPKFEPAAALAAIRSQAITTLVVVPAMLALLAAAVEQRRPGSRDIHGSDPAPSADKVQLSSRGNGERQAGGATVECKSAHEGEGEQSCGGLAGVVFPHVQTVLVGGQSLGDELLASSARMFPSATFIQTFACSEACSSITFAVIGSSSSSRRRREGRLEDGSSTVGLAVGRPAHHVQLSVAAADGSPLPRLVVGRVRTRGAHVMKVRCACQRDGRGAVWAHVSVCAHALSGGWGRGCIIS